MHGVAHALGFPRDGLPEDGHSYLYHAAVRTRPAGETLNEVLEAPAAAQCNLQCDRLLSYHFRSAFVRRCR